MKSKFRLPRTKQGENTFESIIQAATKLFGKKGYHSTKISDIVTEAGIATGTYYLYFDDKITLYEYILNDYKHQIRKRLAIAIKDAKSRYEAEREGIKAFIMFAAEDQSSYNIIWESLFINKKLFFDYYKNFAERYSMALKEGYEKGELREMNFETLSYILMGIANFIGLEMLTNDTKKEEEIDKLVDNVMDLLTNGMFVKK